VLKNLERKLTCLIEQAVQENFPTLKDKPLDIILEIPKNKQHGNLTTNVALQLSSTVKSKPLDIAKEIASTIKQSISDLKLEDKIANIQIEEPGFINFFLSNSFLYQILNLIARDVKKVKPTNLGKGKKIQIEFISANPTGPLSIAHGRQAAVGDSLANILKLCGYKVTREYFINDEGNQIEALTASVYTRYMQLYNKQASLPNDGYRGDYVKDIAKKLKTKYKDKLVDHIREEKVKRLISDFSINDILSNIKEDLEKFDVKIDIWFSQRSLSEKSKVKKAIEELKKQELVYQKEKALWFKSTRFGDDKDRVLIKSNGEYTYLAPDIAYHKNKHRRGFDKVINIWGPDHHGYIKRLKAAILALGYSKDFLDIIILQLASLYRDKKPIAMSTRKGQYITLAELVDEIGKDAARFFFLMRKTDSHLDLDIELAKKKSLDNPVYYIQYAHARICGILQQKRENNIKTGKCDFTLLDSEEEKEIIANLIEFPHIIESAARYYEPFFVTLYLRKLADSFHSFYQKHRVLNDNSDLTVARLKLIEAVKNVISEGLTIIGVQAPSKM
jgi:arginyl-tRNA synthetase